MLVFFSSLKHFCLNIKFPECFVFQCAYIHNKHPLFTLPLLFTLSPAFFFFGPFRTYVFTITYLFNIYVCLCVSVCVHTLSNLIIQSLLDWLILQIKANSLHTYATNANKLQKKSTTVFHLPASWYWLHHSCATDVCDKRNKTLMTKHTLGDEYYFEAPDQI